MALESALEDQLRRLVKARQGLIFKLAPTTRGIPDRLVIMPGGRMYLVELKTVTGKLSPAQVYLHAELLNRGVEVITLTGPEEIVKWVQTLGRAEAVRPTVHRKVGNVDVVSS